MNTLMLIKHIEKRILLAQYFNSENEAMQWWLHLPITRDCEVLYLKEREPTGHRYELLYAKHDVPDVVYTKYIICFSKKEALYLKNKIEETKGHHVIQIKKLY